MDPQVSIIIPLYNKQRTIRRAIDSIVAQSYVHWQLIVVDDGSQDNGHKLVEDYDDARIALVRQDNQGPGAARNRGAQECRTPWIAFLDADDEWEPFYLENSLAGLNREKVEVVVSLYTQWPGGATADHELRKVGASVGRYDFTGKESPQFVRGVLCCMNAWNTVMSKRLFDAYGGYYEKNRCTYGEDQVFLFAVGYNEPFALLEPAAVRHHADCSDLKRPDLITPLPPYLEDTDLMLRFCSPEKRPLMAQTLDLLAMHKAEEWTGQKQYAAARKLLSQYPGTRIFGQRYRTCLQRTVPGMHLWWRFKRWITSRFRGKPL